MYMSKAVDANQTCSIPSTGPSSIEVIQRLAVLSFVDANERLECYIITFPILEALRSRI